MAVNREGNPSVQDSERGKVASEKAKFWVWAQKRGGIRAGRTSCRLQLLRTIFR